MKKRILALTLALLSLVMSLAGCSAKHYEYDNYGQFIKLGALDGIKINQSDINDGILNAFHSLYTSEDKLTETTYNKDTAGVGDIYIQTGDTVNIDYVGKKDGVAFEGGTATGYDLVIGSNSFIDGFEDGLVGYKVGDKAILNLRFPDNYTNAELAGKDTVFEVTVNSIKRTAYPEYNDENIKAKTNWNTVAEFEAETKKTVMNNLIWQELYASSKIVSYPKNELKKYYEQNIDSVEYNATMFGMTLSSFVTSYYGYSTMKAFYNEMASKAQSQVKQELIVLAFIEAKPEYAMNDEKYKVEVEKLYNEYVAEQNFTGSFKKFQKQYDRKALEITIYYDVVIDYLRDHCVITDDVTKNGFVTDRNGVRYYVNNEYLTGWQELDPDGDGTKALYYFDTKGYAPNNTNMSVTLQGETEAKFAKFGANGLYEGLYTGTADDGNGTKYYVDGVMQTGLIELDLNTEIEGAEKYFFNLETGYMVKNNVAEVNGVYYKFNDKGIMGEIADGIVYDEANKTTRYFADGVLLTGWVQYDSENDEATAVDFADVVAASNYYYCDPTTGVMAKIGAKVGDLYYSFGEETGIYQGLLTGTFDGKNIVDGVEQPAAE